MKTNNYRHLIRNSNQQEVTNQQEAAMKTKTTATKTITRNWTINLSSEAIAEATEKAVSLLKIPVHEGIIGFLSERRRRAALDINALTPLQRQGEEQRWAAAQRLLDANPEWGKFEFGIASIKDAIALGKGAALVVPLPNYNLPVWQVEEVPEGYLLTCNFSAEKLLIRHSGTVYHVYGSGSDNSARVGKPHAINSWQHNTGAATNKYYCAALLAVQKICWGVKPTPQMISAAHEAAQTELARLAGLATQWHSPLPEE